MLDLIEKERAIRTYQGLRARLKRHVAAWPVALAACALIYFTYVAMGGTAQSPQSGRITGLAVHDTTTLYRDDRDIPHIVAADRHDAYFAEGFAQASDRLFQMDLFRLYVYGELTQMLGPVQLANDEAMRTLDVHDVVDREWSHLSRDDRATLQAFSDGVNAAMRREPLPIEFRLLLYAPRPWTPRDSLAVSFAISASLDDSPDNVVARDELWRSLGRAQYAQLLPLSDPSYDVTSTGVAARRARPASTRVAWFTGKHIAPPAAGSNAWVAGGEHTANGAALLANDPHLSLNVPGVWYVVEMRAPGLHVAGVTVPGIPGVVLGHNDRIAWGTTNAVAATLSVFQPGRLNAENWKPEVFHVRFGRERVKMYYRTAREFGARVDAADGMVLVRWSPYFDTRSALSTVFALDRAASVGEAIHALANYAGPPQNFVIAGTAGTVTYHLAGPIPDDPAWGRYVHPSADLAKQYAPLPFRALPSVPDSRHAVVLSANNKMYPDGYPYRISAMFAPPYRAYRIAALLHERNHYDAAYFSRMQLDAVSPADAEFAHRVAAYARAHPGLLSGGLVDGLANWDGTFAGQSRIATLEERLRSALENAGASPYVAFDALRSRQPPQDSIDALRSAAIDGTRDLEPWNRAGAVQVLHPFGPIGFPFLNAGTLPGDGDKYTVRVQTDDLTQSFRAVWDTGDWDAGGLSIPAGESGEVGSRHYDDLQAAWIRGTLEPLPFSPAAVARATRERLLLTKE